MVFCKSSAIKLYNEEKSFSGTVRIKQNNLKKIKTTIERYYIYYTTGVIRITSFIATERMTYILKCRVRFILCEYFMVLSRLFR